MLLPCKQGDTERAKRFKLHVEDPPRRKHMVFEGGSILADVMKGRTDFWCTKQQWEEEGVRAIAKFAA